MLTAQLECFQFLISKKIVTYTDLVTKLIDEKVWMGNMISFINDHVMAKFKKNATKSIDKLIICKEDKENITKTRIVLIT